VEQHGPQLPVGVDALLAQVYLDLALPKLADDAPVYVAPPIQAAKSNEHDGFPGTLILHRESLRQMIVSAGRQITDWGFRRMAILNTHGGNISVIKSALRELNLKFGLRVEVLSFPYEADITERERAFGIHANDVESSLMYALTPDMVDPAAATCCWIGSLDDPKILQSEFAPATYAWKTLDISRSGTVGDATIATAEKGQQWIEAAATSLAETLSGLVAGE
jgi:creatinine amidohydrolase